MKKMKRTSIQAGIRTFIYQKVIFRGMSSVHIQFIPPNIYNKEQEYISKNDIANDDTEALENVELCQRRLNHVQ